MNFFYFQNNLVLTAKDKEVSCTDASPFRIKVSNNWAYGKVVAQLTKQPLPIPEISGSNPTISKFNLLIGLSITKKDQHEGKERNGPLKKI